MIGVFTFNGKSKDVSGAVRLVAGTKSARRGEWFHEIAHHVDLWLFESLSLAPHNRIVEQAECFWDEFAFKFSRLASFDDQHLTSCQHLQLPAFADSNQSTTVDIIARSTHGVQNAATGE